MVENYLGTCIGTLEAKKDMKENKKFLVFSKSVWIQRFELSRRESETHKKNVNEFEDKRKR